LNAISNLLRPSVRDEAFTPGAAAVHIQIVARYQYPGTRIVHGARVRLLLVCCPFGSGTTAVAGLLARLGASGFGPYFRPADESIPNSYELNAFRDLLQAVVSEATLTPTSGTDVTAMNSCTTRMPTLSPISGNLAMAFAPLPFLMCIHAPIGKKDRSYFVFHPIDGNPTGSLIRAA
jgi:hypothetical protein